jgi:hypothetical protein
MGGRDNVNEFVRQKLAKMGKLSTKPCTCTGNRALWVSMALLVAIAAGIAVMLWLIR